MSGCSRGWGRMSGVRDIAQDLLDRFVGSSGVSSSRPWPSGWAWRSSSGLLVLLLGLRWFTDLAGPAARPTRAGRSTSPTAARRPRSVPAPRPPRGRAARVFSTAREETKTVTTGTPAPASRSSSARTDDHDRARAAPAGGSRRGRHHTDHPPSGGGPPTWPAAVAQRPRPADDDGSAHDHGAAHDDRADHHGGTAADHCHHARGGSACRRPGVDIVADLGEDLRELLSLGRAGPGLSGRGDRRAAHLKLLLDEVDQHVVAQGLGGSEERPPLVEAGQLLDERVQGAGRVEHERLIRMPS